MKSCWDILGIAPNSDKITIKKSYANLLKIYHPEEDPEGYQRLREAYEMAQKLISNEKSLYNNMEKELVSEEKNFKTNELVSLESKLDLNKSEEDNEEITLSNLNFKLEQIYKDLKLRTDMETWKLMLDSEIMWDFSMLSEIRDIFIEFILTHPYLPKSIINMINAAFKFDTMEIELYEYYRDDIVEGLMNIIRNPCPLNFDYLGNLDTQYIDEYLKYRTFAYFNYNNNDLFKEYSTKAYEIYKEDVELMKMIGSSYLQKNMDIESALEYLKKAYALNQSDYDIIYKIGVCLYKKQDYKGAIVYYEKVLRLVNDDVKILEPLAVCYYYTEKYKLSRKYFYKVKERFPSAKNATKYIKSIDKILSGNPRAKIENLYIKDEIKINKHCIRSNRMKKIKENPKVAALMFVAQILVVAVVLIMRNFTSSETINNNFPKVRDVYGVEEYLNSGDMLSVEYSYMLTTKYCCIKDPINDKEFKIIQRPESNKNDKTIIGNVCFLVLKDVAVPCIAPPVQQEIQKKIISGEIKENYNEELKILDGFINEYNTNNGTRYIPYTKCYIDSIKRQ